MSNYEYIIKTTSLGTKEKITNFIYFVVKYTFSHWWSIYAFFSFIALILIYIYSQNLKNFFKGAWAFIYQMYYVRWYATKRFKKEYTEYILLSAMMYPFYLSMWYIFLSHYDYFYNYRIYELFCNPSMHPTSKLIRRVIFRRFSEAADTYWQCLGHEAYFLIPFSDRMVYFFIFLFILWNIYYIISTIFYEFEAYFYMGRNALIFIITMYFFTRVGTHWEIAKHYIRYLILGYYCWTGYVYWFILFLGANAIEDYSDDDEEIDFYNFTDQYMESDDVMERDFGGSELTGMFWNTASWVAEVFWYIWRKTDIYHNLFASKEKKEEIDALYRIHKRHMDNFYMGTDYSKQKLKIISSETRQKRFEWNRKLMGFKQLTLDYRIFVIEDSWMGRFVISLLRQPYYFIIRFYKSILGEPFARYTRKEKEYIPYWKKYKVRYHLAGGNRLDIAELAFDLMPHYEHRDYHADTIGLNKRFLDYYTELTNIQLFGVLPEDDEKLDTKINLEGISPDLHWFCKKVTRNLLISNLQSHRLELWKMLTNHDPFYSKVTRRRKSMLFYNQMLLGVYLTQNLYIEKKPVMYEHFFWRLRDIQAMVYPVWIFFRCLLDEKHKSLSVWQLFHKHYKYRRLTTNAHIRYLLTTLFVASTDQDKEIEQDHYDHYEDVYYGDDEYDIPYFIDRYTHTSYFNGEPTKLGFRAERYYFKPLKNLKLKLLFLKNPDLRKFLEKKLNWPRQSVGPYTYEADPIFWQTFIKGNFWAIVINMEKVSMTINNKGRLFRKNYQRYYSKRLQKDQEIINKYNYKVRLASEWWYTEIWYRYVKYNLKVVRLKLLRPFRNWVAKGLNALKQIWAEEDREFVALYNMYKLTTTTFKNWIINCCKKVLYTVKWLFFSLFKITTYINILKYIFGKIWKKLVSVKNLYFKIVLFEFYITFYVLKESRFFIFFLIERFIYRMKLPFMVYLKDLRIKNKEMAKSVFFSSNPNFSHHLDEYYTKGPIKIRTDWKNINIYTVFKILDSMVRSYRESYMYKRLNEYNKMTILNIRIQFGLQILYGKMRYSNRLPPYYKLSFWRSIRKLIKKIYFIIKNMRYKRKLNVINYKWAKKFNAKNIESRKWFSFTRKKWFGLFEGKQKNFSFRFNFLIRYGLLGIVFFLYVHRFLRPYRIQKRWYKKLYPFGFIKFRYVKSRGARIKFLLPRMRDQITYRWRMEAKLNWIRVEYEKKVLRETGRIINEQTRHELYLEMRKDAILELYDTSLYEKVNNQLEEEERLKSKPIKIIEPKFDRTFSDKKI